MSTMHKRVAICFLALTFGFLAAFMPKPTPKGTLQRIVIDAGHGGKDPGNLGTGKYKTTEKNITLDVALKLGSYINEQFPKVEVIYTRDGDTFPTLQDRVEVANDNNADLFISIHCDAFTKPSASGSSSFVMGMHRSEEALRISMRENASIYMEEDYEEKYGFFDPKDPDTYIALTIRQNAYLEQSLNLSKKIQDQFRERVGRKDRGVKQAGYYVICFTTMPSILVELGFLTNPDEEKFLNSETGKDYMASALFRAFKEYKAEMEGIELEEEIQKEAEPLSSIGVTTEASASNNNLWFDDIPQEKIKQGVRFQVQILTSSVKIEPGNVTFGPLTNVDEYISNGLYKYAVGSTRSFEEAKKAQNLLRENNFLGAFVIAFKNGERISLSEAMK